jgi:iron complex outermembrane recepter protein
MKHRHTLLALSIAAAFHPAVRAAEQESTLSEMVVTATRTAKVVSEAPATVTVVSRKEIADKNVQRVDEALVGTPGVFIRSLGDEQPSNWQNQITLRGIPGYSRTGVLVDGVPINDAFSGGVDMSVVPMDDIQQIEVVPGPFSSLYGGAGMAGVINIITRRPDKREVSAGVNAGSHGFRSLDAGYRNKLSDALAISLSAGHKESDGYVDQYVTKTPSGSGGTVVTGWERTTTTTGTTTYIVGDKGKSAWEQDNYGAKAYIDTQPGSTLTLEASYLTHHTKPGDGSSYLTAGGVPFSSGSASVDGAKTTVRATDFLSTANGDDVTRYSAAYDSKLTPDLKLKASLAYQKNHYWYTSITSSATDSSGPGKLADIPSDSLNGDLQLSFPVGNSQYFVVGTSINRSTLRKKVFELDNWRAEGNRGALGDWADGNSDSLAAYVQDEIAINPALTLYAGARYDRWSTDGTIYINSSLNTYDSRSSSAFSPKLAAVYQLDKNTVIKGAIGRAFRAPNLSDMYSTFGSSTIYWSNPDLKPEKVTTAEISAERKFATGTMLRATYYRSDITNLIYSTTSGINRYKLNAGSAEVRGVDLEARQKLTTGLTAFVNATFVDTTITENTARPDSVGKQIPLQAKRIANIGIEGNAGPWSGSVIGSYTGKMYSKDNNTDVVNDVPGSYDPTFVVSAKVNYKISRNLTASLAIANLFDRDYFQGTSKADGRAVYAGLRLKY